MPIYTTSYGKRYNIPSDIAAQFEKDFPDARIRYEASGEEYDIPLNKRDGFIKAFPNAKTVDRMSTPPKEDAQPEYSGPGGYFAPTTRHEPNPSALIAEEVERQQREAGINPNSAEAISQRFDAMIEALPTSTTKKYDDQVLREDYRRREEQYNKTHRLGMMQAQNPEGYAPYPQRSDDEKTNSRFMPLANVGDETSAVWMIPQPEDYPAPSPEAQRIWERRINEAKAQSQFESGVRGQLWEITKTLDEQDRKNDEEVRQWREESHKRALDGLGALPIPPSTPEESRSYSNLKTAQGLLDEAVKVIEQADRNTHGAAGVGNALRGIKDGLFDPHTWDLGIGELVDANNLRRVIAKSDRNEALTDDERSLLDALATNMAVSSLYGSKVGMGYNIGKGTAQSLPFMIEFALNPIAGSSKTIAGKIARYWLKHNAKGKALKKAGARVIGDIAAATGTMATSGSLRTAADAITRMTGTPLYEITPEGKAVYAGHEQGDTPLKAIGKSATAGSIEYYTELLGGAFGPIGRAVGGVLGKVPGMKSITGYLSRSQAAELIRGIRTSDWAKSVGDFTSRTGWHGMVEEYSEEEIGNILNYFTVGDVQKKDLLDPQQHLETFVSVALMGGFFSAVKTAGYRPARSRAQKQVAILDQQAGDLLGEEWQNIKAACDNNTDAQSGTAALAQVLESSQYNPEQKRAILSYFAAKQSYNGVLLADQKSSEEQTKSPEQTAIENSYDAGYKSVDGDPSVKQAIKQHLDQVSAPFSEERLQQLRAVENPMQYISEHPQEAPQLLEWFKANSTYTGMIEAVQDQINQKIKESDDAVDSRTHTDGNLYTITLKGDNAAQGYITQGDVAFNPDGSVNKTKSNDRVTVRYADGHSEMLSIDDLGRLVETNNAQELKAQNADAIWEEESRRAAAEIDGTTGPSQGDPITLKDGRRGIFYADTGDGNYLVQLEDGSVIPAPQTAVTLLNRQPSQQEQQPTPQPAQTTPQQTAEQTMTPSPAQEPQNGVDNRIGRSLNKEEADNLIAEMENRAESAPELELTPENWTAEFGEDGMVDTPIGKVKMGENQYLKLAQKGRNGKLGMIKPTLTNPDVIIEEIRPNKNGPSERESSFIFVKAFTKLDGSRYYYFTSVTVQKEGREVVISNQEKSHNKISRLFQEGNTVWIKPNSSLHPTTQIEESVLLSDSNGLTSDDNQSALLGINSPANSTNEDTTPFAENQIPADQNNTNTSPEATQTPAKVTYPRDEKTGHILFDQIDDPTVVAAALRNEFGEQALEAAQTKLQDLQGELEKAASTKDTFERLYKQRDLQREITKYQQVVSTLTPTEVEQITPQEMNRAEIQPENVQNETNRSEQQGQETTNADTQTSNADQSEVDENGRPFVKASDGSTVFGEITEDTGLTPAPIKLSEGYQDGNGKGYGRAHIEANHGKQIKKAGFSSVEDFVSYVAKNYNRDNILVGKRRNNGQTTFLIQVSDQHDNTLFVELSGDESYWNVNSAGIFRKGYSNNKETVAKTEPQQPINAVSGDSSLSENEQSGISLSEPNGESTVSTNEDTTNIQENQESASKNTENQTNPLTNKTNTPILPRKQTAPKYAKEIAQFGDEVSIEDVVLRDIALGQKFSWEDHGKSRGIASELGFTGKEAERRSRISMLRNDGITVDDYVHGLWQEYGERFRQDDAQIRDAVLDVLQRVYSPKAAMEQLRNLHAQEEFSQEEQNILTPEEREAFWNIPVSEYAFREPEANTPEEQQIIDQAKQNGTYMKAPNGQHSNLTEKQWVQVRTQAFKNWFGDWEKAARIEKLRRSKPLVVSGNDYQEKYELNSRSAGKYIVDSLRGEYINADTQSTIRISRKSQKVAHHDAESEAHLKSIAYIPQMIENAVFVDELTNIKDKNGFDSYRYYVVGLKMDGIDYTAKLTVGVKHGEAYYDHSLTEIEKSNLIDQIDLVKAQVYDDKAAKSPIVKDKRLVSLLQTNSSNKIDKNREPLASEVDRFEQENIRFREAEEDRYLIAVHNLSEEKLKQALDLGGFPMPSIAITKAGVGHTSFGDISLLFDKESINPSDQRNKVYGEDAWTPTFPSVGYKLNDEKTNDIYRRANKAGSLPLFNPVNFHPDNFERHIDSLSSDSLVKHFKDDYGAKQLYLSETGNAVTKWEEHEVDKYLPDQIRLYEDVLNTIGLDRLKNESYDTLQEEIKKNLGDHYDVDFENMPPLRLQRRIGNTIQHAVDYAANGNKKTEADLEATKKKIDERIDQKKFENWLEELFSGVVEDRGIRNDKDMFTPSGRSRKWEDLYDAITLDSVVRNMQNQAARGGQGLFGGSIFGAAQEQYKSIDEIRKDARKRISERSKEEMDAERQAITDRLSAIQIPGVGNRVSDQFDLVQNIQDAVAHSHTPKGIYNYLKDYYPKMTMEAANDISGIVKDIQKMSARYFEAKPYRAVGFNEVRLAVVPSGTNEKIIEELERRNIPVRTYESGNDLQRKQIVEEATRELNLRFREQARTLQTVNDQFNAELQQQIEGTLPQGHIYQLGHPSEALQAAGIPNLPIELAASRLSDKSMQANHPFELSEIENLPEAIQQPLAVFRSATHIGSYVVMTEIEHQGKNYVAAIQTHRQKGRLEINDIRSIHYRRTNTHMVNWIDEGLLEYVDKQKMVEWLSKQRYNSAEVRKLFNHATNIVNSFENPTLSDGEKVATAEELAQSLHTPIRIVKNVNEINANEKDALRKRRAYGWYDMETGEVVIVLPNCRDAAEVQATILHEVVGHKGLRELVGEEKYNDLLRRVFDSLDEETRRRLLSRYGHPLIAADEYLASLAEENVEPNVLKRILAQVRNWLREVLGMDIKLSDNDLRYLLWRSKNNLQSKQGIFERAETIAKDAELRNRLGIDSQMREQSANTDDATLDDVNRRFNEQLKSLNKENAQSTILNLGNPGAVLLSSGISDKPIKLYGNKLLKKMSKHGFSIADVQDLPLKINAPIAVFQGSVDNSFAILTELKIHDNNILASLSIGKGNDIDFNIVSSVYGKADNSIVSWITKGKALYVDKEKALNYLRISAPLAEAQDNQELSLATNIIKNFENPTLPSEENIRFREKEAPSDLPTSQVSSSQEKLREELKHLRTLRKGLDSEVMQYRKRGAQNESSSTRQLKDIIARYNRSQRQIREYVNDILDAQAATTLGKREINTLLSALVRATDPQKAEQAVHLILDTVTTARLRAETARTEKLYSTKIQGETPQGVPEAKGVDDNTRVMIEYFRAHKEENINESEEALRTKQATEGLTPTEQMHMDAIYLIRLYQQATEVGNDYMVASAQMEQLEQQIDTLSKEVWHLQRAKATGGEARRKRTIEQKQQTMVQKGHLLEATRWQLQELKQNYLEQLQGFNDILQEVILNGRSAYLDWVHKQQDRQREILQGAFADAGPKAMASARQYGGWKPQGPLHKSVLAMRDFFTAPLLSLDYLIRKHTQSAPNGEGHLYNQFIRGEGGYMEASNRYFERTREITDALGEAAQRYMGISGKNMGQRWLRAQAQARRSPLTFSLQLNDGSQPQVISATQALYLRALEKQTDGQVKLRAMGISEEVMEQISQTLQQEAPEMVALADWVQEQLLPSLRESYNATHLRLFGTQMREVAHYFPISINKRETYRENDGTEHEQTLPTTTTGSIISRKPNTTAIDWNMDFFEVLDRHIQQMEHWNAYSEVVQNMNRLTSNTLFKKSLEYKNPGEARKFMDAARVAAEQYRIQVLDHESVIVKLSQAAASSKINFRGWTAIKQIASSPAFVAYSADPQFWATLSKHVATLPATLLGRGDYSWAKANLPDFRRRVQGGTAGNDALERESFSVVRKLSKDPRSPLSYGMWANAHMDAVVCAMGAKAVYEYQLNRHKRRGLSESEAQRAARRDAELSYNLSQQSALGVNLSPMQRSRNFFSVIFSTFQNAQFLYGRQLGDALRELTRSTELETEALYQRYRTQGMESAQARRAALKDVSLAKRTSVVRILTYGWGLQLLWVAMSNALPYIFGGDDDDKNLWVESAKNPAVWIGPLQGLFGGGNLTSIAEGYPFGGPMLFEDISRFWRNYGEAAQSQGIFSWETAGVTLDLLTEFSLSQNSETFMNLYNGVQAFIDGHSTAGLLQLLNAPRSQIKKILLQRGEHESLMQYAERINNLQELFRAMDRSAQGARGTSYPLYEELEQAN